MNSPFAVPLSTLGVFRPAKETSFFGGATGPAELTLLMVRTGADPTKKSGRARENT
jgi:hypothetical protein